MEPARSATDALRELNRNGHLTPNNGVTHIGRGVNMEDRSTDIDIVIPDPDRSGHIGFFGTTRVGKTGLLSVIVGQDIKKGYNTVIIDPKGDVDLFSRMIQYAAESGRLDDVMLLTPIYPDHSIKIDPLSHYYMQDELVDHVISGIKAKDDFYIAVASEVTQAIIAGLAILSQQHATRLNTNFDQIRERMDYLALEALRREIAVLPGNTPEAEDVINSLDKILHSPQDFFSKVSSSLRTTVSALSTGNTGKIIGKSFANDFVKRFEDGRGVILYCNTGSLLARRTAHIIARVLISMIQSMVGRFFSSGKKLDPPLCIHIDEGQNVLYQGIQDLFSKAGGANVWLSFYTQSIALIEQEIGQESARGILDNMNTLIFLRVNHPETARYMEDSTPFIKKFQSIITPDDSTGRTTLREMDDRLIPAANVLQLAQRQFYMRYQGRFYKAFTLDLPPKYVEITFPEVSGSDLAQQPGTTQNDASAVTETQESI